MVGGGWVNRDTDVLLGFSGKVGIIGRWDFCDIRQNRGLKGVGEMHLYRVDINMLINALTYMFPSQSLILRF